MTSDPLLAQRNSAVEAVIPLFYRRFPQAGQRPLAEKVVDAVIAEVAARLRERGEERIDGWSPAINWSEAAKLVESEFGAESYS